MRLNAASSQPALGMQRLFDLMQITDAAVLNHDMFVQFRFGQLEMQQAPSAQHRKGIKAAPESGAFMIGVRSQRCGKTHA